MKAPNSNIQAPEKFQASNSNDPMRTMNDWKIFRQPGLQIFQASVIDVWNLELLWSLELGAWRFFKC
jgi:hypothetical protein